MNPNNSSQGGGAPGPTGPQSPQNTTPHNPQDAAANVLRSQIDALYGNSPTAPAAQTHLQATPAAETPQDVHPYQRNHSVNPQPQEDQWKTYHSAWQDYYQKYYAAYYEHQTSKKTEAPQETVAEAEPQGYFSQQPPEEHRSVIGEDITKDEALFELRQKLLGKVRTRAGKIRGSRHFVPVISALVVVLMFVFLQYNRVFFATVNAYVSPGAIDPQNIVIDPTGDSSVSADPRLVIPKINVDVPAVYGVGADYDSQMAAMEKGVAHFAIPGANSRPGEVGNTVLSGHSSNDLFDKGDYKFIFAQLDKLTTGDTIYANYEGKRYTYVVTKKEVVSPSNVGALIYTTNKPVLTLITCTPLGTSRDRLLITAEQVSPDPAQAATAPEGSGQVSEEDSASIPGSSPTFLERIFGAR